MLQAQIDLLGYPDIEISFESDTTIEEIALNLGRSGEIKSISFLFGGDSIDPKIQKFIIQECLKLQSLRTFIFCGAPDFSPKFHFHRFMNELLTAFNDKAITVCLDNLPVGYLAFWDPVVIEKLIMPVQIMGEIHVGITCDATIKEIVSPILPKADERYQCQAKTLVYGKWHDFIHCEWEKFTAILGNTLDN